MAPIKLNILHISWVLVGIEFVINTAFLNFHIFFMSLYLPSWTQSFETMSFFRHSTLNTSVLLTTSMTTMKREHIVALPYFHDNTEHFCIADNFYDNNEKGTHCCTSILPWQHWTLLYCWQLLLWQQWKRNTLLHFHTSKTTLNTSVLLTTSMTTMKREHTVALPWQHWTLLYCWQPHLWQQWKGNHCCTTMEKLNTSVLLTTTSMTTMKREHAAAFTW